MHPKVKNPGNSALDHTVFDEHFSKTVWIQNGLNKVRSGMAGLRLPRGALGPLGSFAVDSLNTMSTRIADQAGIAGEMLGKINIRINEIGGTTTPTAICSRLNPTTSLADHLTSESFDLITEATYQNAVRDLFQAKATEHRTQRPEKACVLTEASAIVADLTLVLAVANSEACAIEAVRGDSTIATRFMAGLGRLPLATGRQYSILDRPAHEMVAGAITQLPMDLLGVNEKPRALEPGTVELVIDPFNARSLAGTSGPALLDPNAQYRVLSSCREPDGRTVVHLTDLRNIRITPGDTAQLINRWLRGGTSQTLVKYLSREGGLDIDPTNPETYPPVLKNITLNHYDNLSAQSPDNRVMATSRAIGIPCRIVEQWVRD